LDPTGLVWLGARYYDPKRGRFISPDPIGHPLCLDLYGYANGDPINYNDLDGRFASSAYQSTKETVISTVNHPRFQGTMQAMGGLGEAFMGGSITVGSYGTAGLIGMPVMAHGLDHFFTGAQTVYYGTPQETATSLALQKAGLSSHRANLVDNGLSIVGSMGGVLAVQKGYTVATKTANRTVQVLEGHVTQSTTAPQLLNETLCCNPLKGTSYSQKVLNQVKPNGKTGLPDFHGFPQIVDNYASLGSKELITGRDGISRIKVSLSGNYQGKDGHFEWIIESNKMVNHRLFLPRK